jgi:hypothetical protein
MKRLLHGAALAATVICQTQAGAQTVYTCGQGTVRRAEAVNETVTPETITIRLGDDADGVAAGTTEGEPRRSYVVSVQLGDRLYTSQSSGDPYGTLDPLRLYPGDAIGICVNSTQMILERPDGTDYRAPLGIRNLESGIWNARARRGPTQRDRVPTNSKSRLPNS